MSETKLVTQTNHSFLHRVFQVNTTEIQGYVERQDRFGRTFHLTRDSTRADSERILFTVKMRRIAFRSSTMVRELVTCGLLGEADGV